MISPLPDVQAYDPAEPLEDQPVSPASSDPPDESEPVWNFRGYRLRPSEFNTAMVHFFRAEVQRANVWRQRLDTTTNWAVLSTGAAITIGFTQGGHHSVILLSTLLVTLFLYTEARRYRYYELWSSRIRLIETDFYAAMLVPPFHPGPDWAETLAESLLHPRFPVSMAEAFGRRYRRNYLWIYLILGLAWVAKVTLTGAGQSPSWAEIQANMSLGSIPGLLILAIGLAFNGSLFVLGLVTQSLHEASGEVLPRYGEKSEEHFKGVAHPGKGPAWYRSSHYRKQFLAVIITDKAPEISQCVLVEMARGVTALSGVGMFTHQSHSVLLCALTITEIHQIKSLVSRIDPKAFVIVSPAQEVLGRGFEPFPEK